MGNVGVKKMPKKTPNPEKNHLKPQNHKPRPTLITSSPCKHAIHPTQPFTRRPADAKGSNVLKLPIFLVVQLHVLTIYVLIPTHYDGTKFHCTLPFWRPTGPRALLHPIFSYAPRPAREITANAVEVNEIYAPLRTVQSWTTPWTTSADHIARQGSQQNHGHL